jgi:hypothetical protein
MATKTSRSGAIALIVAHKPFTAGGNAYGRPNFRGEDYGSKYEIYSYNTRIAEVDVVARKCYFVEAKYSQSTTRHQNSVRAAFSDLVTNHNYTLEVL